MALEPSGIRLYPAPWNLRGSGYILIYRFAREFVENNGFLSDTFKGSFQGGFGAAMLVNYECSTAGPYQELLFIPGNVNYRGYNRKTISKIYVSTDDSVANGRINWGIPKELARFRFRKTGKNTESIEVTNGPTTFFSAQLESGGLKFPVSTAVAPFTLMQYIDELLFTNFSGRGWAQLASVKSLQINQGLFPDFSERKPLFAIRVDPFVITFPVARKPL